MTTNANLANASGSRDRDHHGPSPTPQSQISRTSSPPTLGRASIGRVGGNAGGTTGGASSRPSSVGSSVASKAGWIGAKRMEKETRDGVSHVWCCPPIFSKC